ncbi:MAG: hypothetical protein AB4352_14785 [Hormoscilla sp.]
MLELCIVGWAMPTLTFVTNSRSIVKQTKKKKKNFSSFKYKEACKQLNITELLLWDIEVEPVPISDFFRQRLERLQCFDLQSYEESRKLIIDAICEEAIQKFNTLKIWKGASLETEVTNGNVDYLVAARKAYLEAPYLCIVEAKKDDFEQGLAKCLVEMQACQWENKQIGKEIDVLGIVTNGDTWKFYQLTVDGNVYQTLSHAIGEMGTVLGLLRFLFQACTQYLS